MRFSKPVAGCDEFKPVQSRVAFDSQMKLRYRCVISFAFAQDSISSMEDPISWKLDLMSLPWYGNEVGIC